MEKTVILVIEPATWCDQAAELLATTIRGAPCYTVDDMRLEVERGDARLVRVRTEEGALVGFAVLRIDVYQGGAEGVIVAGAGSLAGARLYEDVVPALERLFSGVKSYRVESCRRGGDRKLAELGYEATHRIWRKPAPPELRGDDVLEALQACGGEAIGTGRRGSGGPDLRARPGKLHGGGGGSSSSSSSQTSTNTDKRLVVDGNSLGISSDSSTVTVNTLDDAAIAKAFEFATASDQETGKTLNSVLGVAAHVFDKAGATVDASASLVSKAYDDAKGDGTEKTILIAAGIATLAIVALTVLKK